MQTTDPEPGDALARVDGQSDSDGDHLPEPGEPDEMRPLWLEQDRAPTPPDLFGFGVRFGCGAIFGVFLAAAFFLFDVGYMVGAGLACGLGAAVLGDRFWKIGYIFWPFGLRR